MILLCDNMSFLSVPARFPKLNTCVILLHERLSVTSLVADSKCAIDRMAFELAFNSVNLGNKCKPFKEFKDEQCINLIIE